MKLREFNAENTIGRNSRSSTPSLTMNSKSGRISLSDGLMDLASFTVDSQIIFHQDEDDPANWYMEVVGKAGFKLKKPGKGGGVYASSTAFVRKLFSAFDIQDQCVRFLIAGKPTKVDKRQLWGIIIPV